MTFPNLFAFVLHQSCPIRYQLGIPEKVSPLSIFASENTTPDAK
jgi:hypothetical protein